MGRRATKKVEVNNAVVLNQRFIYRGYLQIACCDLTRDAHPCLWLITWDPTQRTATRPLAIQKDGTWYCYGWDLTKNVCEVFGQAGYIRTTYTYSPYGAVTASGDVSQPFRWSSEFDDEELGLVYYNYRHFNPTDGRWISRDLLGESNSTYNLYNYCMNAPISFADYIGNDICHIVDPKGAFGFGHSMFIIGNKKDKYKVYSYGPQEGGMSSSGSSDMSSRQFSGSPKDTGNEFKTIESAINYLRRTENGNNNANTWTIQRWATTPEEDRLAKKVADAYIKEKYSTWSHNCYTLIIVVFKQINIDDSDGRKETGKSHRPNNAFEKTRKQITLKIRPCLGLIIVGLKIGLKR